jgi:hypothetical protein
MLADLVDRLYKTENSISSKGKDLLETSQHQIMPSIVYLLKEVIALMYYRPDTRTSLWTSKLSVRNLFIILVWTVFGKLCQQLGGSLVETACDEKDEDDDKETNSSSTEDKEDSDDSEDIEATEDEDEKETQNDKLLFSRRLCNLLDSVHEHLGELRICSAGQGSVYSN